MSDEERDDEAAAEPTPARPKKKKKRRAAIAAARSAAASTVEATPPAPAQTWTNGHLAAALAVGIVVGGLGGWAKWGRGAEGAAPGKDTATAQGSARGTAAAPPGARAPQPDPAVPVYIPLASYSPREGPEHAKVTIVEFSDFQ